MKRNVEGDFRDSPDFRRFLRDAGAKSIVETAAGSGAGTTVPVSR